MVKKLNIDDFFSNLDAFYTESKNKYSVYLTFKRVYAEKFKYKKNKKIRKQRIEDRKQQDKTVEKFNVLVRARLRKKRIHTVLTPDQLEKFQNNLMNVLTLYFIREENTSLQPRPKRMPKKNLSRTQRRKMKRFRKIKAKTMIVARK